MSSQDSDPKIVFLDAKTMHPRFPLERPQAAHEWQEFQSTSAEQLLERISDAHTIITSKVILNRDSLLHCQNLKHIAVAATGYNVIDIQACNELGIKVSNIPSYSSRSVAEHIITTTLMLRRNILSYRQSVIDGDWQQSQLFCLFKEPIKEIHETRLGIVGYGDIGSATAKLASSMGFQVQVASPNTRQNDYPQMSLDDLLINSDVISVNCSLNPSTQNLIGCAELKLMPKHGLLINAARGGVVNELALAQALLNNEIGGAAIDVLSQEPPQDLDALLELSHLRNVIITPHIAWASDISLNDLGNKLTANINSFLIGHPQNLVI